MGQSPAPRARFDVPYVTDEKRLYEIVGARSGVLMLKDSAKPDEPIITRTAKDLKGLRSLRPL